MLRPTPNYLPMDIVSELIGWFEFTGGDADADIAEQIANNSYSSIEDCLQTIKGCISKKSALKRYDKDVKEIKSNPYFAKYFADAKK